ncbi:17295_t:CDS:2, partial [Racocetra persica]
ILGVQCANEPYQIADKVADYSSSQTVCDASRLSSSPFHVASGVYEDLLE